jgi:hypothetical protein
MAQSFDCLCATPTCRGRIAGARDMTPRQLEGLWLNGHIRALLEERERGDADAGAGGCKKQQANGTNGVNGIADAYDAFGAGVSGVSAGAQRRGPTSRELSGEMGGDTSVVV